MAAIAPAEVSVAKPKEEPKASVTNWRVRPESVGNKSRSDRPLYQAQSPKPELGQQDRQVQQVQQDRHDQRDREGQQDRQVQQDRHDQRDREGQQDRHEQRYKEGQRYKDGQQDNRQGQQDNRQGRQTQGGQHFGRGGQQNQQCQQNRGGQQTRGGHFSRGGQQNQRGQQNRGGQHLAKGGPRNSINRSEADGGRSQESDNAKVQEDQEGGQEGPRKAEKVVTEIEGDLFDAPPEHSLAHCVAEDMRMGRGIAVTFKQKFGNVPELLDQRKGVGSAAVLRVASRYVYYLVTKPLSSDKPTMGTLRRSLLEMRSHCIDHDVKHLAIPQIGCGLDRLIWTEVKHMLEETFKDTGVQITVYIFPQSDELKDEMPRKKSNLFIVHKAMDLVSIESKTGLVYLCSETGPPTATMSSLDAKHHFLPKHDAAKKTAGSVVRIEARTEVLYGFVVKAGEKDRLNYGHLDSCLKQLRKMNVKDAFGYVGLEAFRDGDDATTMEKVLTCVRNVFNSYAYQLEVWFCWPKAFVQDHFWEDERRVD